MRHRIILLLTFVSCLVSTGAAQEPPKLAAAKSTATPQKKADDKKEEEKPDTWLLVKNVHVYPVVGPIQRYSRILVKNGKIQAMGPEVEVPSEAKDVKTLDGMGFRAYPGLVHLNGGGILPSPRGKQVDALNPYGLPTVMGLAHGITTVLVGTNAVKLLTGTLEGATVGEGLYMGLMYSSKRPRDKKKLREDFRKARDYLRAKKSAAKKAGAKGANTSKAKTPSKKKGASDGTRSLGSAARLLPLLEGKQVAMFNATDAHSLREIADLVGTYRFKAVIRGATEGWTLADELGRAGVSVILIPRVRQDEDVKSNRSTGSNLKNAAILHEHGVPVAIVPAEGRLNMDGGSGHDILTLALEAGAAVRGGLPEAAALEAITIQPARMLAIDDRVGSLEVGKDADIILCDGDILNYKTMVQWAIVNGKVVYDKEEEPLYGRIRSRSGKKPAAQWWPRPIAPMPDDWAYDVEAAVKRKLDAEKKAEESKSEAGKGEKKGPGKPEKAPAGKKTPSKKTTTQKK